MLPSKLKNMNLHTDGYSWLGQVGEVTLPKLTRKMEGWRGGGMQGEIKVDMGQDSLECEWTIGGLALQALRQYGQVDVSGTLLRFMGAYQADDGSPVQAVEAVIRGRHEEIDMGGSKPGGDTETKIKTACTYYKLVVDGRVEIEIDMIANVLIVDGFDRNLELRAALGLI